jgi:hypothetical protein
VADKLVQSAGSFFARRTSRRGFLVRVTTVGSALAVGPVRFLVYPEPASAVVHPTQCAATDKCKQGWVEFCCSLFNNSGYNYCPRYAYVAGWWKCTYYGGYEICKNARRSRYYIDCNRKPGRTCTAKCAGNKCHYWDTCYRVFRYPQCNKQHPKTEVVCRIVRCKHPSTIYQGCKDKTVKFDDDTCTHEASCGCGTCQHATAPV